MFVRQFASSPKLCQYHQVVYRGSGGGAPGGGCIALADVLIAELLPARPCACCAPRQTGGPGTRRDERNLWCALKTINAMLKHNLWFGGSGGAGAGGRCVLGPGSEGEPEPGCGCTAAPRRNARAPSPGFRERGEQRCGSD